MKLVKPSKQTMLKGLLLLVVGLNFSWRPLLTESHQTSMASAATDAAAKAAAAKTAPAAKAATPAAKKQDATNPAAATTATATTPATAAAIVAPAAVASQDVAGKAPAVPAPTFSMTTSDGKTIANTTQTSDDSIFVSKVCDGKFITLKKQLDGKYAVTAMNSSKEILKCDTCAGSIFNTDGQPLTKEMVDFAKTTLIASNNLKCDDLMTEKELEAYNEKKKAEAEEKVKLAQDIVKCLVDKKGENLSADKRVDCELSHMLYSDKDFKKAGIDADEANKIRADFAKASLSSIAKMCKKSHKKDDDNGDFADCEDKLQTYREAVSGLDSDDKKLAKIYKDSSEKADKLDKFVVAEEKAIAEVDAFKAKYDGINAKMTKTYDAYVARCDNTAVQFQSHNQEFNTDACVSAYVKNYLVPTYGPQLKAITSRFTSEESKFKREFEELGKKADIIGADGAQSARAPFVDYTKTFANFAPNYQIPAYDLPQIEGSSALAGSAIASNLSADDLLGRFGNANQTGVRTFTPLAAAAGWDKVGSTTNPFAIPAVLGGGTAARQQQVYRSTNPTASMNRQTVTSGLLLPVQDAGITW